MDLGPVGQRAAAEGDDDLFHPNLSLSLYTYICIYIYIYVYTLFLERLMT